VLGQAIDCYFENTPLTIEQLKTLHINKTAKLIAASLLIGAVIVDLDKKTQDRLYQFGLDVGLLFQIQDDIIDATQSEQEVGKTTGNDGNKNSFVNLLGVQVSINKADSLATRLQQELTIFEKPLREALESVINPYLFRHKRK